MRLWLKLFLMVAAAALIQRSLPAAGHYAYEARFAARCWLAHQFRDAHLQEQLIRECQRQTLERYLRQLVRDGECGLAEDVRRALEDLTVDGHAPFSQTGSMTSGDVCAAK